MLQNLIGNAFKYTDRGFVEMRCYREGDALVVAVEDSGIGIPSDKLDRIFDDTGDLPSVLRSIKSPVVNCRFLSKPVDTAELVDAIAELSAVS